MTVLLQLVSRFRPSLRGLITAGLAAAGGLLLLLGSVLPWVGGPDADAVTYGVVTTATATATGTGTGTEGGTGTIVGTGTGSALGSRAGLAGGDAFVTLLAGAVAVALAAGYALGRARRWQQVTLAGAGILALSWAVLNQAEIGDVAGPDGATLDIDPGVGVYVCIVAATLLVVAAVAAPRDVEHDLRVLGQRAERLVRRGLGFEAVEKQQQLLRRARRSPGWDDPRLTFEALYLARLYLIVGHVDRGVQLVHEVMAQAPQRFGDDHAGLESARAEAGGIVADANAQLAAVRRQLGMPYG